MVTLFVPNQTDQNSINSSLFYFGFFRPGVPGGTTHPSPSNTTLLCIHIYIFQGWCTPTHPTIQHYYVYTSIFYRASVHPPTHHPTIQHYYVYVSVCSRPGVPGGTTHPPPPPSDLETPSNTTLLCIHIYIFQGRCIRGNHSPTTTATGPRDALQYNIIMYMYLFVSRDNL